MIFTSLVPIFGIIFLGIVVERYRFMPKATASCLNQFVYWISLPTLLFSQIAQVDKDRLFDAFVGGYVLMLLIGYGLAQVFFSKGFTVSTPENTVRTLLTNFPNSAYMGIPIVMLIMPGNVPAAVAASLASVLPSIVLIMADTILAMESNHKQSQKERLKHFGKALYGNPLLVGVTLGGFVSFFAVPLGPFLTMTQMLGATASPCALFGLGMMLTAQMMSVRDSANRSLLEPVSVHVFKLIGLPALTWFILSMFGIDGGALAAGVLVASMPTGLAPYVVAEKYNVYAEESSVYIFMNTAFSMISLPAWMLLLRHVGLFG